MYGCRVCAHECRCLQRTDKGVRPSGVGDTGGYEWSDVGDLNPGPLEEREVLLTPVPYFGHMA